MPEIIDRKLETQQKAVETELGKELVGVRAKINTLIAKDGYEMFQMVATVLSIIMEPVGKHLAHKYGLPIDDATLSVIDNYVFNAIFGANLGLKTVVHGATHLKTAEAWIDIISVLSPIAHKFGVDVGEPRVARMIKALTRGMRLGKVKGVKKNLEDITMAEMSETETWKMMGMFTLLPLMFHITDATYEDINAVLKELGFYAGMGGLMVWGQRRNRRSINKNYTRGFARARETVEEARNRSPELIVLQTKLANALDKIGQGESEDDIQDLVGQLVLQMEQTKELANPPGEVMEIDESGIKPKEIESVVMATDLRNFTALSEVLGKEIFEQLNNNYYPFLLALIKHYGGKRVGFAGDAIFAYFEDTTYANGNTVAKEELAMKCGQVMNQVTNKMAEIWLRVGQKHGLTTHHHHTGIGFGSGTICVGDALSFGEISGNPAIAEIHQETYGALKNFPWADVHNQRSEISSLVGIGRPLNHAARLESETKKFQNANCLIPKYLYDQLPPKWQAVYNAVGQENLKGITEPVKIYGIKRFAA